MADFDDDGGSFTLVEEQHRGKKHKVTEQEPPRTIHSYEAPARVSFQANATPGTKIPLAAHVRMLTEELSRADKAVSFLSIDKKHSYYPSNDKFPDDEGKFKEFFTIHYPTRKTNHLVTVGCIIRTTKTISEMKKSTDPTTSILKWLKENKVFIAVDSIGHHAARTIGNLINIHPRITHRTTLRDTIFDALQAIPMTKEEVIEMAPDAKLHYEQAMDSGDEVVTFVPPFEVFPTTLIHGPATDRVKTDSIGIASASHHYKLLSELTTRLFKNPPRHIAHAQFLPSGIHMIIGEPTYRNILQKNNEFLTQGASIPVDGIDENTLDTRITVTINNKQEDITVRELLLRNSWCTQVEKTETPGKIIIVTTKGQLPVARRWIDDKFPRLFSTYLPRNPNYKPYQPTPPTRTDKMDTTAAATSYAEALKTKFQPLANSITDSKFNEPPARKPSRKFQFTFDPNEFPNLTTKKARQTTNDTTTSSVTTEHTKNTKNTTATAELTQQTTSIAPPRTKIDLDALKEEIRKSLQADLQRIVQTEITPIRNQIEPLRNEMRTNNDALIAQMESLADMLKMLNARFDALNNTSSQSHSSTNGRGDGRS